MKILFTIVAFVEACEFLFLFSMKYFFMENVSDVEMWQHEVEMSLSFIIFLGSLILAEVWHER